MANEEQTVNAENTVTDNMETYQAREYTIAFTYAVGDKVYDITIKPVMRDNEVQNFSLALDSLGDEIAKEGKAFIKCSYFSLQNGSNIVVPHKLILNNIIGVQAAIPSFVNPQQASDNSDKEVVNNFQDSVVSASVAKAEKQAVDPEIVN